MQLAMSTAAPSNRPDNRHVNLASCLSSPYAESEANQWNRHEDSELIFATWYDQQQSLQIASLKSNATAQLYLH